MMGWLHTAESAPAEGALKAAVHPTDNNAVKRPMHADFLIPAIHIHISSREF